MAEPRKSATLVEARKQARERAAVYQEREQKLEDLATEYIVNDDKMAGLAEGLREEIEKLEAAAEAASAEARDAAVGIIQRMSTLGATPKEIAERLDVSLKDVRAAVKLPAANRPDGDSPAAVDTDDTGTLGAESADE